MSSDPETTDASIRSKTPIQILREVRGGVPRELIERNRRQNAIRQRIVAVLQQAPTTIPDLACQVELPAHEVLWHVMGMRKYGRVTEMEQVDGYFKYGLFGESYPTEAAP